MAIETRNKRQGEQQKYGYRGEVRMGSLAQTRVNSVGGTAAG